MTISKEPIPFENFTSRGENYVVLNTDLEGILSLQKYKVVFYAEYMESKNDTFVTDITDWIALPPPSVEIRSSENFVSIRPGESKNILLNFSSTTGYGPIVSLFKKESPGISVSTDSANFTIPSSGTISIPVTFRASEQAIPGFENISIITNTTFYFPQRAQDSIVVLSINTDIKANSVIRILNIPVQIQDPYSTTELLTL
jgi:hypothetical protein